MIIIQIPYPKMTWSIRFIKEIKKDTLEVYGQELVLDFTIGCREDVDLALTTLKVAKNLGISTTFLPSVTTG